MPQQEPRSGLPILQDFTLNQGSATSLTTAALLKTYIKKGRLTSISNSASDSLSDDRTGKGNIKKDRY